MSHEVGFTRLLYPSRVKKVIDKYHSSVPFNPAVATRFLDYYSDTLQFQSTLSYLKSPPPSYQQPGVDLLKGLEDLKKGVQEGIFPNQVGAPEFFIILLAFFK